MKKNRYCTTASPRRKPEKELRKKLFRPFTRAAACVTAVFIILVSGITAFFIYNGLKKELVSRAAASARAAVISSALRLENAFTAARADALTLLQINGAERQSDIFFELHPEFAAIAPSTGRMLVNKSFFLEHDLSEKSLDNYLAAESELLEYAATLEDPADMLFGNASAYTGAPLLSMFFRDTEAGGTDGVIAAFFSLAAFTPLLESGTGNVVKTFVVNYRDDILLGSGGFFTPGGNYWRDPLVRLMRQSAETEAQSVFTGRDGGVYIGAFRKLPFTGTAVLCEISENAAFSGLPEAALGSLKFCGAALVLAAFFCAMLSFSMDKYAGGILREQEEKVMERRRLKSVFRALPTDRKTDFDVLKKLPRYGEEKDVTVLFAGVRGFRDFAKNLSPRKTLESLNEMLTLMTDIFSKTGGSADKICGDTLTGVWGAPFSEGPEKDALNAVRGALMLRSALIQRGGGEGCDDFSGVSAGANSDRTARLKVCCGINSGLMIAGETGPKGRGEYTFTGNAVKRARLLEALNKRFGTDILISEYTLALAGKYFITEELPPVKIRGSKKELRVFAVINVKVTKSGIKQPKPTNLDELRQMLSTTPE